MKFILLDRDGVINVDREDYIKNLMEFNFFPGTLDALFNFFSEGFDVFVFTNQACISKGLTTLNHVNDIHKFININIQPHFIKHFFICPHTDEMNCNCRKPKDGMIKELINNFPGYDLDACFVVGDNIRDLIPAFDNQLKRVLVKTGNGINAMNDKLLPNDTLIFENLYDFSISKWISSHEK